MSGFFKRGDDLERRLRSERPAPRAEFMSRLTERIESAPHRRSSFRFGLAAAVSAVILVSLAAFGGLSYAASSVTHAVQTAVHVVAPAHPAAKAVPTAAFNAAAAQYGGKTSICTVEPNGKQHTITISNNAVASYLATHPRAFRGACGAFRPPGVTANVCIKLKPSRFSAVFVPARLVRGYLKKNSGSFTTKNGKCVGHA
jgi:hypothetical protein